MLLKHSITSPWEAEEAFALHDATKQGLQADWRLETMPPASPDSTLPIRLVWEKRNLL